MAKLIYSMLTSLDGHVEDADGGFGWAAPRSDEVHAFANEIGASVGTYLYGRRLYETMVFWETAHEVPGLGPVELDWSRRPVPSGRFEGNAAYLDLRSPRWRVLALPDRLPDGAHVAWPAPMPRSSKRRTAKPWR